MGFKDISVLAVFIASMMFGSLQATESCPDSMGDFSEDETTMGAQSEPAASSSNPSPSSSTSSSSSSSSSSDSSSYSMDTTGGSDLFPDSSSETW